MNIHPDLLAAIGAAQIGSNVPVTVLCDRHDHSNKVSNGMCRYTRELLDGLASLSVAAADKQVVAIALQMGSPAILTVAENGPVNPELLDHLRDMLDFLQRMVVEYGKMGNWNGPPTEIPPRVRPYRNKLIRAVYLYSVDKIAKRFEIYWNRLEMDIRTCDARGNAKKLGKEGNWFKNILYSLEYLRKFLRKIKHNRNSILEVHWADLIREMDRTICYLASGNLSVAGIFNDKRTGTRCIEMLNKLSSQHHHIQNLTKIAHAVRVDPKITFDMVVRESTVSPKVEVILPKEIEDLELMINFITKREIRPSDDKTASAIFQNWPRVAYGKVHCECALIAHLDNLPPDESPVPCNYIGVSKLSCAPCGVWIHAFNATRGPGSRIRTYHTMGTHSKWYRNWAMPQTPSSFLLSLEMEPILCEKLARGFTKSKLLGSSDSTIVTNTNDSLSQDLEGVDGTPYLLWQSEIDNGSRVFLPQPN